MNSPFLPKMVNFPFSKGMTSKLYVLIEGSDVVVTVLPMKMANSFKILFLLLVWFTAICFVSGMPPNMNSMQVHPGGNARGMSSQVTENLSK